MTAAQYLQIERAAETKSEFWNGEMCASARCTCMRSLIAANVMGEMYGRLKESRFTVYNSELRLKIERANAYVYPDVSVVCQEPLIEDDDVSLNPAALVEVASESTDGKGRSPKFKYYRQIPFLQEYVLASQYHPHIEHYIRQTDGKWLLRDVNGVEASLSMPTLGIEIPLAEIFAGVVFPSEK